MESALGHHLPPDLVQYILEIAVATRIQAIARGSLARIHRRPMGRHGFEELGGGAYRYAGGDFARDLYLWMASFRPHAYSVCIEMTHTDRVATILGPERAMVSACIHCPLFQDFEIYSSAFVPCHGRPCEYRVHVSIHDDCTPSHRSGIWT